MPTVRLFNWRWLPVWVSVEAFVSVRRTVATSPGSAVPSGTFEQTPVPGWPGLSQAEFSRELHFCGIDGSLFGSGSPEVQIGSAEPSSESSTAAIARLPTALMLCATFVIPDAVWLQTI